MRAVIATTLMLAGVTGAAAQMNQDDKNAHSLHGLLTIYAAANVCQFKAWSFTKQDTGEMLARIKVLGGLVPKKTNDDMWKQAQDIMAEGQAMATGDRCAKVREQYAAGRPFLLGLQPIQP